MPIRWGRRPRQGPFTVTWDATVAEKGGCDLFMLKEVAEQPQAVADTLLGSIAPLDPSSWVRAPARTDAERQPRTEGSSGG